MPIEVSVQLSNRAGPQVFGRQCLPHVTATSRRKHAKSPPEVAAHMAMARISSLGRNVGKVRAPIRDEVQGMVQSHLLAVGMQRSTGVLAKHAGEMACRAIDPCGNLFD